MIRSTDTIIDVSDHAPLELCVLSSEAGAARMRTKLGLDRFDESPDKVVIRIPHPSVTHPYLRGLLGPSLDKLGVDKFKTHYQFETNQFNAIIIEDFIEFWPGAERERLAV